MTTTPQRLRQSGEVRHRLLTVRARLVVVVTVAVTALVVLVAVNAARDWEQQAALRADSATGELGGEASLPLFVGAQAERRVTAVYLADPTKANRAALEEQRAVTDRGIASFRHLSGSELEAGQRHKWEYVERVYDKLDALAEVRQRADTRAGRADEVTGYYTELLVTLIEFYQELSAMDDARLTAEARALVGLFWAAEGLSQQDMLIAQARARGRMSAGERAAFAEAYGTQRVMYERWIAPYLPAKDKAAYERIVADDEWKTKEKVEEALISAPAADSGAVEELPRELERWDGSYGPLAQQLGALNLARTQGLLAHGYERADEVRDQVVWQIAFSLTAVLLIAFLIIGVIRSVTRRLRAMQSLAEDTAERLPELVGRLQQGHHVEAADEIPQLSGRHDEFTGVERGLATALAMTIEMAARRAADRRGFSDFVAATTARALNLVNGQLDTLSALELKYQQDDGLVGELIDVDHLGNQARRHLDNLMSLAGAVQQTYTEPKSLAALVQDAAAETHAPTRVKNKISANVWIGPGAVNDVLHVVSALVDNALAYSPPDADVRVSHVTAVNGTAVEIEDRGKGMTPEAYARANGILSDPPTFETIARKRDGRLGLFVVANLARRHHLLVSLRRSDYGGTTAVALLPHTVQCPQPTQRPQATPIVAPAALPAQPLRATPSGQPVLPRRLPAPSGEQRTQLPVRTNTGSSAAATGPAPEAGGAPRLPKRRPQTHMAPQLAEPAPTRPGYDPAGDRSPEEVAATWGSWQRS
ncbi:nitrate- and nitrite sensing domain-containing protein [Streptomyces sp. NPDC059943]|uniref:sensor histidine kinase n=1 Tax=Streptomyces sp. NPDC059943 TaxID=3347010 RepID=UPI0036585BB1